MQLGGYLTMSVIDFMPKQKRLTKKDQTSLKLYLINRFYSEFTLAEK